MFGSDNANENSGRHAAKATILRSWQGKLGKTALLIAMRQSNQSGQIILLSVKICLPNNAINLFSSYLMFFENLTFNAKTTRDSVYFSKINSIFMPSNRPTYYYASAEELLRGNECS